MVRIAPGERPFKPTFVLGTDDDPELPDPRGAKEIEMERAFAIGRYAVTQEEFLVFSVAMRQKPLRYDCNRRWPATEVNWRDAMAYCRWLEAVTGYAYRLPSEVEWEYACRAGTTTFFSWGDDWNPAKAASGETRNVGADRGPVNVESYDPNYWGLWQMHGNVWEWCADPWHENHQDRPNGQGIWDAGADYNLRVLRGGGWFSVPDGLRSAFRYWYGRSNCYDDVGFRLARKLTP